MPCITYKSSFHISQATNCDFWSDQELLNLLAVWLFLIFFCSDGSCISAKEIFATVTNFLIFNDSTPQVTMKPLYDLICTSEESGEELSCIYRFTHGYSCKNGNWVLVDSGKDAWCGSAVKETWDKISKICMRKGLETCKHMHEGGV